MTDLARRSVRADSVGAVVQGGATLTGILAGLTIPFAWRDTPTIKPKEIYKNYQQYDVSGWLHFTFLGRVQCQGHHSPIAF